MRIWIKYGHVTSPYCATSAKLPAGDIINGLLNPEAFYGPLLFRVRSKRSYNCQWSRNTPTFTQNAIQYWQEGHLILIYKQEVQDFEVSTFISYVP